MKSRLTIFILLIIISSCKQKEEIFHNRTVLNVYAYENKFCIDYWQNNLIPFEEIFDCKVQLTIFEDPINMYAEIIQAQDSIKIDLVLGIDNILATKAIVDSLFMEVDIKNINSSDNIVKPKNNTLIPLFYSPMAFLYNLEEIPDAPETFGEMQDGIWKDKLIVSNPLTSAMGNSFLGWSIAAFGLNGYGHFWRSMKANIYAITPNWDTAIDMFLADEAPMVICPSSYLGYFLQRENSFKYDIFIPSEGTFIYSEFGGVLNKSTQKDKAVSLLNYLLSDQFQGTVANQRWMIPINKNINYNLKLCEYKQDLTKNLKDYVVVKKYRGWGKRWNQLIN